GPQPLVSEAVRGEGAFLVDVRGRRFMAGAHELADLAPRDVVARGIARAMAETGADHVYLDARHFGAARWERRFPTILASCRAHGVDPVTDLIPVTPAAHYASGGIRVDHDGRTAVPGLYAVGEVARTGVHGANRLASNSLLEGVVFADRIAAALAEERPPATVPARPGRPGPAGLADPAILPELREIMSRHVGVRREAGGLATAAEALAELAARDTADVPPGVPAWQAANLLTVAWALVRAAARRCETRGSHWRSDHEQPSAEARSRTFVLDGSGIREERSMRPYTLPAQLVEELDRITVPEAMRRGAAPGRSGERPAAWHEELVRTALAEDRSGEQVDVTTVATIPAAQTRTADVVARRDGVVAGLPVAELVFRTVCGGVLEVVRHAADGDPVKSGDVLMTVTARTRDLLTAERTALNFLTHLSGIATATRAWVDAVAGTGAAIRDSRKTLPGLRVLEKYAVRCGGGVNHRFGLADAALVKDNHVAAAGGVSEAVRAVRERFPDTPLEVEVDRIDQIEPALAAGAEEILLDNFTVPQLREAVALVAGRARLESSGGLTLDRAADVAATGVDYLAVGALTHSSPALDIALDLRETP
ncbi:carboxylating nicotinate-nucleotide diphosphorylase, partial [Thermobifida halotolerans]|uniref:carboxylating nicotinate-nucleotide diphosphorylase n=1 Tax=Thermobifida halotolerans TaxID=483545 RepID=UPI001F47FA55